MLKLDNIEKDYIKVTSNNLVNTILHPELYKSVTVEASMSCCSDTKYTKELPLAPIDTACSACSEEYAFRLDLKAIAYSKHDISGIYVKNMVTGLEYNVLTTPINFDSFLEVCGDGSCTLQSQATYVVAFREAISEWFEENVQWFNTTVSFCGDTLTVCDLPQNFILTRVEYSNQNAYFSFNEELDHLILNEGLYLTPFFFEQEQFKDGIYQVKIKFVKLNGSWIEESNCFFLDVETKCKVSRFIEGLKEKEVVSTTIHIAHYALTNASNCGCNCTEMCELYRYLVKTLDNNVKTEDCEC
jgi:hypothetical protein